MLAGQTLRDNKGRLLVCYHGTSSKFSIFSHKKLGSSTDYGLYGDGFYFTDDSNIAKKYGNNLLSVYLNIEKPYYIKNYMDTSNMLNYIDDGIEDILTGD